MVVRWYLIGIESHAESAVTGMIDTTVRSDDGSQSGGRFGRLGDRLKIIHRRVTLGLVRPDLLVFLDWSYGWNGSVVDHSRLVLAVLLLLLVLDVEDLNGLLLGLGYRGRCDRYGCGQRLVGLLDDDLDDGLGLGRVVVVSWRLLVVVALVVALGIGSCQWVVERIALRVVGYRFHLHGVRRWTTGTTLTERQVLTLVAALRLILLGEDRERAGQNYSLEKKKRKYGYLRLISIINIYKILKIG